MLLNWKLKLLYVVVGPTKTTYPVQMWTISNPSYQLVVLGAGQLVKMKVVCILSFSVPVGICLVNEAELIALRMGPSEAARLCFHFSMVEGDSSCVFRWALVSSWHSCCLADAAKKVLELAVRMNVSFLHVLHSTNDAADSLDNEGVERPALVVDMFPSWSLLRRFGSCLSFVFLVLTFFNGFLCVCFAVYVYYTFNKFLVTIPQKKKKSKNEEKGIC